MQSSDESRIRSPPRTRAHRPIFGRMTRCADACACRPAVASLRPMTTRSVASLVLLAAGALGTGAVAAPPTPSGWDIELLQRYPTAKVYDQARDADLRQSRAELDRRKAALARAERLYRASTDPDLCFPNHSALQALDAERVSYRQLVADLDADIAKIEARFRAEKVRLEPLWSARSKRSV